MRFSDINTGTKLEITICSENGRPIGPTMISEIDKVVDEDNLLLIAPFYQGLIYPLRILTLVSISFCGEDAMYSFSGVVSGRERLLDKIEYVSVKRQGEIRKIQRREFFRFDCVLDIKYKELNPLEEDNQLNEKTKNTYEFLKSYTTDISGGGLCFISNKSFDLKQMIEVQIDLEGVWITLNGRIVRKKSDGKGAAKRYRIGISFVDICERDRQKIIEYIFKQQRNLREKGLI